MSESTARPIAFVAPAMGAVLAVAALLAMTAPSVAATPATHYVDDDGSAGPAAGCDGRRTAFRRIQPAVDASGRGDTILVCPGRYSPFVVRGSDHDGLTLRSVVPWQARVVLQPALRFAAPDSLRFLFAAKVVGARNVTIQDFHIKAAATDLRRCSPGVLVQFRGASGRILTNRLTSPPIQHFACVSVLNAIRALAIPGSELSESVEIRGNVIRIHGEREVIVSGDGDHLNGRQMHALVSGNIVDRPAYAIEGLGGGMDADDARVQFLDNATVNIRISAYYSTVEIRRNRLDQAVQGINAWCTNGTIAGNRIDGVSFGANGIIASGQSGSSWIQNNTVKGFVGGMGEGSPDGKGIWITSDVCERAAGTSAPTFVIRDNDFRGNGDPDCADHTSGDKSAGTANLWRRNLGDEALPSGICRPSF